MNVIDYVGNKYDIDDILIDKFNLLNDRAVDFRLDLSENYNAAFEMFAYFKPFQIIE